VRKVAVLFCLAVVAAAQDRWVEFRFGPFQVMTNAGERSGQQTLAQLEQLRWALGTVLGRQDLKTVWPVRVLVFKKRDKAEGLSLNRDAFIGALLANAPIPRLWLRDCAQILIEANARRMPSGIESGLIDFYSTAQVSGAKITAGRALPESERNLNWAKIHLLSVDPNYYGKLRVLLYNLQQGAEAEPAYRNAFGRTPAQIDKEAAAYLAAGSFSEITISGRPLNPQRDLIAKPVNPPAAEVALADLSRDRSAYEAILKRNPGNAAALEGLGLLALREKRDAEARKYLAAAIEAGSVNARAHLEYGRPAKAAELNPDWAEPHFLMARQEADPKMKVRHLKTATTLEPRNAGYWQALAEAHLAANEFPDAAKAWAAAEQATVDEAERTRIRAARQAIEQQRLEYQAAERRRAAEEKERDLQRVKAAALAEIRAAEARANRGGPPTRDDKKVEQWWEGEAPSGKIRGRLTQVDCRRGPIVLLLEGEDRKLTRLVIRDPKRIVVIGGGQLDLSCGPQRSPRTVVVEYFPKNDPKLATAGEVATIEYR
jgi:hypothetical protein